MNNKRKKWFKIILVMSPLFLLVFTELALRFYMYAMYSVPGKNYGLWRYDETLGAQHQENGYNTLTQTNDHGFRNREDVIKPKPKNALRFIAYGGSTTFCYNLSDEKTWPQQLQKILREKHHRQNQVLNAGAISWSLGHAFARAQKEIPQLQPDFVIIYSGINEETNATTLAAAGIDLSSHVHSKKYGLFSKNLDQNRWAKRNLVIVRLLDYRIKKLFKKPSPKKVSTKILENPLPHVLENYLQVLQNFIRLVNQYNGKVIFVSQACGKKERKRLTLYSTQGLKAAKKLGCTVINAQLFVDEYRGNKMDLFYHTGVHYSAQGATKLAHYIFTRIKNEL
ncbi:SGNH/GDSL hydrolase family protein [Candidatus Uabimicrobium amorphum]|uniref:SGNH hydrolase-type esterase domain-containing protein n=1 Tax=Uabimicrobium amorphum TaxID=2596890 RepID=A0A5S9ILU3_UABAM|nr:SGNH/GDSL hydrolase family protein [Candidatus Uabimicrobium amorphum]BBM83901.1 hypothetical protein UABAM_02256 [Candidatus Uabimicrobium amorphum]